MAIPMLFAALTQPACSQGAGQNPGVTPPKDALPLPSLEGSEWKLADLPSPVIRDKACAPSLMQQEDSSSKCCERAALRDRLDPRARPAGWAQPLDYATPVIGSSST